MNEIANIIPCSLTQNNLCRVCNFDSIELYDKNGKPMNYRLMVNMNNYSSIDKLFNYLSYFKCTRCGTKYTILWNNGIPVPLQTNTRINEFISKFTKEDD